MRTMKRRFGSLTLRAIPVVAAVCFASNLCAPAQALNDKPGQPMNNQSVKVSLIAQDSSDCSNSTVKDDPDRTRGGVVAVQRNTDGTTSVVVSMSVAPSTTYHFYLKCVRALGDIKTDEEGYGSATFAFQTASVGHVFAFDMYPDGAPSGNKYQSLTVTFP